MNWLALRGRTALIVSSSLQVRLRHGTDSECAEVIEALNTFTKCFKL